MKVVPNTKHNNWTTKAYEYIKEAIIEGKLEKSFLSEQEIGTHLGCSRTPVREAIRQLQKEGYVNFIPNRGVTVMELSLKDIFEIFQIREALEPFVAKIACKKIPPEVIEFFDKDMRDTTKSLEQLIFSYNQLHGEILKWAGNERINYILKTFSDQIKRIYKVADKIPGRLELSHQQHLIIFEALKARDEFLMERAVREHILSIKEATLSSLQNF
jgi:DNA-binding GntR family transcriptional regulator